MPSPTIATTLPSACSSVTLAAFCSGRTSARTCSIPTCARDRLGRGAVVAGQHPDVEAQRLELRDRLARFGLERVGDGDEAGQLAVDRDVHRRRARSRPARRAARTGRRADRPFAPSARGCRAALRWPSTVAWMPWPVIDWKSLDRRQVEPSSRARPTIASPSGCSEPTSAAAASRSSVRLGATVGAARRAVTAGLPRVSVPVLSSTIVSIRARLLERLAAPDQDAVLGRLAGADHDRGRRRQAERAGAGDDQHRDGGLQRERQRGSGPSTSQPTKVSAASTSTAGTK